MIEGRKHVILPFLHLISLVICLEIPELPCKSGIYCGFKSIEGTRIVFFDCNWLAFEIVISLLWLDLP